MQRCGSGGRLAKKLADMLRSEEKRLGRLSCELKELPEGRLIIKRSGGKYYMYRRRGREELGITKDRELCAALARKYVLKTEIMICTGNCSALKEALEAVKRFENGKMSLRAATDERINSIFPEAGRRYTREALLWAGAPYKRSGFMPANLKYVTKSGIRVRSKSERIIADLLTELGIPFRYEAELVIDGKTYYPDFVILCEDGTIIIWEHFGMTDDREYFYKMCRKLEDYRRAGYCTHTNLICTYEDDVVSEEKLRDIVDRYILSRSV